MASPDNSYHKIVEWNEFKSWLKKQHMVGNDLLGLRVASALQGVDDIGFIAFNNSHIVRNEAALHRAHTYIRHDIVQILQDPDDDPRCFIFLADECNSSTLKMQIAWSRHYFLPATDEECRI